jgi:3-deoxy-manno-octulosonate cytidylyltransferase (CMP-KDO synthetase)
VTAAFRIVIPARHASARLPGKPLLPLAGKPMIRWVYERACDCDAAEVVVATDDARIAAAAREFGADVAMTSSRHETGTDRIAEVAAQRGWPAEAIVVNLQGDEPLMPAVLVLQVADLLARHASADIATLAGPLAGLEAFLDPNVVKVVTAATGRALYFSRAPIPWNRDAAPQGLASQRACEGARRHIGLYAYRVAALRRLAGLAPTRLERLEKLEQLRALEHGLDIRVEDATVLPGPDVNTAADLDRVAALLSASPGGAP